MKYIKPLNEKKPKGAPDFHHSDAPDAEGRFRDLGIKDLAAWLIKTRKGDVKKISGSLTQQVVFNRNEDPEYAEKMEKVRKEVYKQLDRQDLIDKMDESVNEGIGMGTIEPFLPVILAYIESGGAGRLFYKIKKNLKAIPKVINNFRNMKDITRILNKLEKHPKINGYLNNLDPEGVEVMFQELSMADMKIMYGHLGLDWNPKEYLEIKRKADKGEWANESIKESYEDMLKDGYGHVHFIVKDLATAENLADKIEAKDLADCDYYEEDGKVYLRAALSVGYGGKEVANIKKIERIVKQKAAAGSPEIWAADESVINEEDSYNDYPAAAKKNAQMAIDWKEKYGRDEVPAGTPVGWARAHQLAKGEKISADTVKRMSAFNRHRKNSKIAPEHKDEPWKDNGYVAWLIWGGDEGVDWAIEKSKEIDAMKESKQMKYIRPLHEAKFPGRKGEFIKRGDEYIEIKKTSGSTAYVKFANTASHAFAQVWDDEVTLSDEKHRGKRVWLMESNALNEGYWSGYDYSKWTKENGKPKYPKWVKVTLKEIVKGGFMEDHYDSEHMYMVLWLGSFDNQTRAHLSAYDKKGIKEFGKVGYKLVRDRWNDLTGYNMFFMMGAMYALEVSKQIQDRIANGESVEPAYYMMKEYFNNFGMDTKRSRIFNAAYEKLEKWMKDNNIKTL